MNISAEWMAPKELPMLTDLEFKLKSGETIMVSWESATFGKRKFDASGVSTTDSDGKVEVGNLKFLKENIDSLIRIHYLSDSADGDHIKTVLFSDRIRGRYKSETWRFDNPNYHHHM